MNELLCIGKSVAEVISNATLVYFVDDAFHFWIIHLFKLSVNINLHFPAYINVYFWLN